LTDCHDTVAMAITKMSQPIEIRFANISSQFLATYQAIGTAMMDAIKTNFANENESIVTIFIINEFVTIAAYLKFKKYIDPHRVQPSGQGVIDTL